MHKNLLKNLSKKAPSFLKGCIKFLLFPRYYSRIFFNDLRSFLGWVSYPTKIIFVAGYPKSGTTWMENFLSNIPGYSPRVIHGDPELIRHHNLPDNAFSQFPKHGYSAVKSHLFPSKRNIEILISNGVFKVLVMYRDPRDIVVSNYYHILEDNPWEISDSFYADYNKMSKDDAISHSLEMTLDDYLSWVKGWREMAFKQEGLDCMCVRYEDFRENPEKIFNEVLTFFCVDLSSDRLKLIMTSSQNVPKGFMSIMPGRKSTRRKGLTGEWKMELNNEHKKIFKDKASEILIELGYEKDTNW